VSTHAGCSPCFVVDEVAVEDVGEASFERAPGLSGSLSFVELALVVDAAGAWIAGLDECDGVQGVVELAVAGGVEPVAATFAAGGFQRCGAGVAGEMIGAREPGHVADVAEDFGGDEVSDTPHVSDGGMRLGEDRPNLGLVVEQTPVEVA
jgi:hypothetical protein